MSDKPVGEIFGRQDLGTPAAAETVAPAGVPEPAQSTTQAGAMPAEGGGKSTEEADPIAGLKSALGKERERASRLEKDWKASQRAQRQRDQQVEALQRELVTLRTSVNKPDPGAIEAQFWGVDGGPPAFIDQRLAQEAQQRAREAYFERREEGRDLMRDEHEDFEEVEHVFLEAAAKDPSLLNDINNKRPFLQAKAVYKAGKKLMAGGEASSPMSEIAKLQAEIAELKAGRDGGQTSQASETAPAVTQKPSVPKSNVGVRGSGVGKTSSWAGPTPVEKIWGRQRSASR